MLATEQGSGLHSIKNMPGEYPLYFVDIHFFMKSLFHTGSGLTIHPYPQLRIQIKNPCRLHTESGNVLIRYGHVFYFLAGDTLFVYQYEALIGKTEYIPDQFETNLKLLSFN